ncbi:MAG: hypothetical protein AVDCRST_MAG61-847 [uncultured Friedmanniella sp.]|uniref:Peptidylprolyl isomerase n=1 Tax=uncultured Friedmanniella sp. TaxID=335381 RepID=A0A6J4KAJ5_9ACTN|nr:SurA N-terminal domain-containing protein [uncultured Friedmanniella sp.]CAA9299362.1 MAG: hypothetical protein AVDCRST_MAG61-847 [uncultured Friedmanniella sp.]
MKSLPAPRLRRAAAAAVALVALVGCSNASPSVVAYVGDAKVTQTEVDEALTGLRSTLEEGQTISSEAVLNTMIQGELAAQIAADRGITLTDAQRDSVLAQSELAPLVKVPGARELVYDLADSQLVSSEVGTDAYLAELKARKVKLNPRYGVLDPEQKILVTGRSGSLSEPAEAPPAP